MQLFLIRAPSQSTHIYLYSEAEDIQYFFLLGCPFIPQPLPKV